MVLRSVTFVAVLLAIAGVAMIAPRAALADTRIALVIGNSAYRSVARLPNPANDAAAMGDLFKRAGFDDVHIAIDLGVSDLHKELGAFAEKAAGADIAVVFYAGHGIEIGGRNYLIPVDAVLAHDYDVEHETVNLDNILQSLEPTKRLKLVILDACRDNPFAATMKRSVAKRAISRGLAQPDLQSSESDTLVAYAQRAGAEASDGEGAHSPFTSALLRHLTTPGLDVRFALGKVHEDVLKATDHEQEPFLYGALAGDVLALVPGKTEPPADPEASARADYALAKQINTVQIWNEFKRKYLSGFWQAAADTELQKLTADSPAPQEDRRQQVAALPRPVKPDISGPCGGAVLASLNARSPSPLSAQEACVLQPKDVFKECADCPEMVVVPSGSFAMGSPASERGRTDGEEPRQQVRIAKPFAAGTTTVSFAQWDACVAEGGCRNFLPGDMGWGRGDLPVIFVSWDDAKAYSKWLSAKTDRHYRLLSEAEWEYVARACNSAACQDSTFWFGNAIAPERANYDWRYSYAGSPKAQALRKTAPVGHFQANPFGLYNIIGNVNQWVEDCWNPNLADLPADGSPRMRGDCTSHVLRGGSWSDEPKDLRSASRTWDIATSRKPQYGFRVAREVTN